MKAKNVTLEQLNQALANVNASQGYQLVWNRQPEQHGNYLHFTIRSRVSKVHGASVSHSGRNTPAASWEAHGYFFTEIWQLAHDAEIRTMHATYLPPRHRFKWSRERWVDYVLVGMGREIKASQNAY